MKISSNAELLYQKKWNKINLSAALRVLFFFRLNDFY